MHMHVFLKRTTNMLVYLLTISCVRRARGSNVIADAGHVRAANISFQFSGSPFLLSWPITWSCLRFDRRWL